MTVEQRADDAAAQHAFERFVFFARLPLGDDLVAVGKASDMQAFRIRRSTTEAREIRRVSFLDTFDRILNPKRCDCRGGPPWPPVLRFGDRRAATEGRPYNYAVDDRNCWRSLKR